MRSLILDFNSWTISKASRKDMTEVLLKSQIDPISHLPDLHFLKANISVSSCRGNKSRSQVEPIGAEENAEANLRCPFSEALGLLFEMFSMRSMFFYPKQIKALNYPHPRIFQSPLSRSNARDDVLRSSKHGHYFFTNTGITFGNESLVATWLLKHQLS